MIIKEYKNSKGEIIINTILSCGYGIALRNEKYIAMDLIGNEFEFDKFESVAKFVASASKWDESRIEIYNKIKSME